VFGAYLGMAVCIVNVSGNSGGVLSYVAYLLPISSVFVTPIFILLGKISVVWGLVSLFVQIISLAGLALFTAKVYEALILHNGNRLKLKDLISITKEAKGETR
jgi:ABC-2 type transport system permease protein